MAKYDENINKFVEYLVRADTELLIIANETPPILSEETEHYFMSTDEIETIHRMIKCALNIVYTVSYMRIVDGFDNDFDKEN